MITPFSPPCHAPRVTRALSFTSLTRCHASLATSSCLVLVSAPLKTQNNLRVFCRLIWEITSSDSKRPRIRDLHRYPIKPDFSNESRERGIRCSETERKYGQYQSHVLIQPVISYLLNDSQSS